MNGVPPEILSESKLRNFTLRIVKETASKFGSGFSTTPKQVVTLLGLEIIESPMSDFRDGCLLEKKILLNSLITCPERKNFTIFHEITHFLILSKGSEIISSLHDICHKDVDFTNALESLCNLGAAELLMPEKEFRSFVKSNEFNIKSIIEASDHFNSSLIASAIQFAAIAPHPCFVLICECGPVPRDRSHQTRFLGDPCPASMKLHVLYSAKSASQKYHISRYTPIPKDHVIDVVYESKTFIGDKSYVPFRSGKKMPCYCEALFHKGRVFAVLEMGCRPNKNQLEFHLS